MITENLSTLKIHKMSEAQYRRELAAGNIDATSLYLTPDEEIDLSGYAKLAQLDDKLDKNLGSAENGKILSVNENGDIIPVDIGEKTYKTFADLGLDDKTATIPDIVEAMPDTSSIILYTGANSNPALSPMSETESILGAIVVHKIGNWRTSLTFETTPTLGKMYHGSYYRTSGSSTGTWTGWIEVAHQENLMNIDLRTTQAELNIQNMSSNIMSLLTNYTLTEKSDCFDFSDLTGNRTFSVSYYVAGSANKPSTGYGFLFTYRVTANAYLMLAVDSTGLYHGSYSNGSGSWTAK